MDQINLKEGTRFFEHLQKLPLIINFDFKINDIECQMIPIFTLNREPWGSGNEDALSFYASP